MLKQSSTLLLALASLMLFCQTSSAAPSVVAGGELEADSTWSGDVVVEKTVVVPAGIKLLIEAGARVRFAPEAGLNVSGELVVDGLAERPVWLGPDGEADDDAPAKALWPGIRLFNSKSSRIGHARIVGANWNEVINSFLKVHDTTVEKGQGGFKFTTGGRSLVLECSFAQLVESGVSVTTGTAVEVFDSTFSRCANFGVVNGQRGLVRVKGCAFENCKMGVQVMSDGSMIENNSFKDCNIAIAVIQASGKLVIGGNRISGGDVGILCNQFASPRVIANTISGAKEGIRCFQGSSPTLIYNRVEECGKGISCIQLCKPLVEKNQLINNKVGIYLQTSSYAVIQRNNFEDNGVHLELGDMMSADWERRVTKKPKRARQARNEKLVKLGRAVPEELETKVAYSGEVSAMSNWWGEASTAEMVEKGADAQITGLIDSFDTPKATYQGYEGEYLLDRITYADWLSAPVGDAGPEGFAKLKKVEEQLEAPSGDEAPPE